MLLSKWRKLKLSSRITISFTIIFIVAILSMAIISLFLIQRFLLVNSINDVSTLREQISTIIEANRSNFDGAPLNNRVTLMQQEIENLFGSKDSTYFYIEDTQNNNSSANEEKFQTDTAEVTILDINSLKFNVQGLGDNTSIEDLVINRYKEHESTLLLTKSERQLYDAITQFEFEGNRYLYTAVTYEVEGYTMLIHIIRGLQFNDRLNMTLAYSLLLAGVVSLLLIIIVGRIAIRSALSPLNQIAKAVKEINNNQMHVRMPIMESNDELQTLTESLNNMFDKLQGVFESQTRFVSDASHELRIPLTIIKGYLDLYNTIGQDNPAIAQESITAIDEETKNMQLLVENLLLLSRIDKKGLRPNIEIFDLQPFIDRMLNDATMISNQHLFTLGHVDEGKLYGDEKLLLQVIRALVENSVKYTPSGGEIMLSATTDQHYINISVKDTGIGINQEDIPHLFERFYRCDSSRDKASGGTGLGLAIVESIIKLHDGKIQVYSEKNVGTEIVIRIPKAL